MSLRPSQSQLIALESYPKDKAISMVNIIKFRDQTPDGSEAGKAAYKRYIVASMPFVEAVGGKLVWRGKVTNTVIGNDTIQPDIIFIVQYPSVATFFAMLNNPEYQKVATIRELALEIGDIIACEM